MRQTSRSENCFATKIAERLENVGASPRRTDRVADKRAQ